ncbi:MAG: peptide chain release factor N(5)-glutamine methyltransferase [Candidatus Omnitrophota bacterium]
MKTITEIESKLKEHGVESSRINAETILTSILGCRVVDLYVEDVELGPGQLKQLEDMVERRISGEPLQYITGKVNFYGNELLIEPGVFIPRSETEILVETVIKQFTIYDMRYAICEPLVLDLCTGSGNIAISLTKRLAGCKILASDISDAAIRLARKNAAYNGVSERIDFIKADLFKIPVIYKERFDAIVSNPPYVASDMMNDLPVDVKNEPHAALYGGRDGMDFYQRIVKESPGFLKDKGILFLELGDDAAIKVKKFFEKSIYFDNVQTFNDLNKRERVIAASKV